MPCVALAGGLRSHVVGAMVNRQVERHDRVAAQLAAAVVRVRHSIHTRCVGHPVNPCKLLA